MKQRKAFSLVELAIVILIIGIVVAGVTQGTRLISAYRLSSAQQLSQSSPVVSIAGLVLWLDATNNISFIETEAQDEFKLSKWNDSDPHENPKHNAAQTSTDAQPVYVASAINGLPAVRFDGAQYMDIPYVSELNTASYTVIVAVKPIVLPGAGYSGIVCNRGEASTTKGYIVYLTSGNNYRGWVGTSGGWRGQNSYFTAVANRSEIFATSYDASPAINSQYAYFYRGRITNGGTYSTTDSGFTIVTQSTQPMRIGASANITNPTPIAPTSFFNGYIGEIIIFNRKISSEERKAIEDYLAKKWGVK